MTIITTIIGFGIEFVIQTVFLTLALWIMIKLQKLNYNVLGLIGSAALASAVGVVLDNYIGLAISSIIVVVILAICITKVTHAEHTDVMFTIGVSFALTFGMNLWLMGMLMGDLRVTARTKESIEQAMAEATNNAARIAAESAVQAKAEAEQKSFRDLTGKITLKGITKSATTPLVVVSTGGKAYTLTLGESFTMPTATNKFVVVTCKEIQDDKVLLDVAGKPVTLTFLPGKN